jgi:hypothetical protein
MREGGIMYRSVSALLSSVTLGLLWPAAAWGQVLPFLIFDEDDDGLIESGELVHFGADETLNGQPCSGYSWEFSDFEEFTLLEANERVVALIFGIPGEYSGNLTRTCEVEPGVAAHEFAHFVFDVEPAEAEDDADGDGIADSVDNCRGLYNPEQDETDTDGDGFPDLCDNCALAANPDQSNCDPQWDENNPTGLEGDACDPDPCTAWQNPVYHSVLHPSSEDLGNGNIAQGGRAEFAFDAMGGSMDPNSLSFFADGSGDEHAVDVAARYCSCRHADPGLDGCRDDCEEDGVVSGEALTGLGWLPMTRRVGGDTSREPIPDVLFRREGGSIGVHSWDWQGDECPAANPGNPHVACGALSENQQRFRLWLRPLVDDGTWPTGWEEDEHNFYSFGEESMSVRVLPQPGDPLPWPGWPFIPEGPCYECGMRFFGEQFLPMFREFDPAFPLPTSSPYRFAGAGGGDAIQGLGVLLLDPDSLTPVVFVPSEGVTSADEPRVTKSLTCVAPAAGDADLWLFGGLNGAGAASGALYRGQTDTDVILWTRISATGSTPAGRTDGLLAFDPVTESLVLYAGKAGTTTLADVWRFDTVSEAWEQAELAHFGGASPGSRHSFAHAQHDTTVYFYGGKDASGAFLADMYELDLTTLTVRAVPQDLSSGGPGARASAGMAAEVGGQSLLLFGGANSAGAASDLWRFDLGTARWSRISRPCTGGACPPSGAASLLAGPRLGSVILPAAVAGEPHPEPYWHFDSARSTASPGWISAGAWRSSPASADCNANSVPDSGLGYACAPSSSWYAAPSSRACDRLGAQLACPQISTSSTGTTSFSAPTPAYFAARDGLVVLASGTSVKRIKLVAGQTPTVISTATLTGTARSVVLDGQLAFVGTSVGVEVYSLAGTSLVKLGQKTLSGGASAMAGDGHRLYVAQGMTFRVYNSTSSLPELGSASMPLTTTPTIATVAGSRVLVAGGTKVCVISVVTPSAPTVVSTPSVGGTTTSLRARGRVGYGMLSTGVTYVLDVSASPALVGTHDVTSWSRGATHLVRFAVQLNGGNLEVATLAP